MTDESLDCEKSIGRKELNLCDQKLSKLTPNFNQSCPDAVYLDVSRNFLRHVENLAKLTQLKEVNISHNQLCRLSGFAAIKHNLERLDVSDNQIQSVDGLNALHKLRWLSLAKNSLPRLPILDCLTKLTYLNLSSNQLSSLPNVSCIKSLQVLLLDENQIESLESAGKYLPSQLKVLSLDQNIIGDLTQFLFLSCLTELEQISLKSNPCIDQDAVYDYRPYLVCCCQCLKTIDGFVVSDTEQLKGEWLYSQGKGRRFQLGQNRQLVDYLKSVCPLQDIVPGRLSTQFDDRIQRVLEKRKQYMEPGDNRSISAPPVQQGNSFIFNSPKNDFTILKPSGGNSSDKENLSSPPKNELIDSRSHLSPKQRNTAEQNPFQSYENQVVAAAVKSPFRQQTTHHLQTISRRTNKPLASALTTSKTKMASITKVSTRKRPTISNSSIQTPTNVLSIKERTVGSRIEWSSVKERKVIKIQAWWRGILCRSQMHSKMALIRLKRMEEWIANSNNNVFSHEKELEKLRQMNPALIGLVESLTDQLSTIKENYQQTITQSNKERETLTERVNNLEMAIIASVPVPCQLTCKAKDQSSTVLSWNTSTPWAIPKNYRLFVDGDHCGDISGKQTCALVTDLDSSVQHEIQIQSVSVTGVMSGFSPKFVIPASQISPQSTQLTDDDESSVEQQLEKSESVLVGD